MRFVILSAQRDGQGEVRAMVEVAGGGVGDRRLDCADRVCIAIYDLIGWYKATNETQR